MPCSCSGASPQEERCDAVIGRSSSNQPNNRIFIEKPLAGKAGAKYHQSIAAILQIFVYILFFMSSKQLKITQSAKAVVRFNDKCYPNLKVVWGQVCHAAVQDASPGNGGGIQLLADLAPTSQIVVLYTHILLFMSIKQLKITQSAKQLSDLVINAMLIKM